MLRPDHVIELFKSRAKIGISDFEQLVEGIQIGGMIVVGGGPKNVQSLMPVMSRLNRLGAVSSIQEMDPRRIDIRKNITFDLAAIAQLLMIAKNESFHATIDQVISLLQTMCVDDGHSIEAGLKAVRDLADEIARM